jgi:hypothetical protein
VIKTGLSILMVTNLGVKQVFEIHRDKAGLRINGARISRSLNPSAVPAYHELQPHNSPEQFGRCAGGIFEIRRGRQKEKGCLENDRAKRVSSAIQHLLKLVQYSRIIK